MIATSKASGKEIFGWGMFDFANQAFTLLIITVIFGDLYTRVIVGDGPDYRLGNWLWSLALCASYLLVVLTAPLLGAVMDYTRSKKKFLFVSYIATVILTALLVFVQPGFVWLGFFLVLLANYAYSVGESFIAAFLPFLGSAGEQGKISGFGWALGYAGGLAAAGFALLFLGEVSAENFERVRWVGPFAAAFFLLAAIPTFLWVKEPIVGKKRPLRTRYFAVGYRRMFQTVRAVADFKDLAWLFASIFLAMAGVYVIIAFAFIYGAQVIGWDEATRNLMFVTVQITALTGALFFGWIQTRFGGKRAYGATLLLWIVAIFAIVGVRELTDFINTTVGGDYAVQSIFLVAGVLSGLSLGSSQATGRALVGVFSPPAKAAEFFGFWGLFSKLAAVFGLFGVGLLQWVFGLEGAVLFCAALFGLSLIPLYLVNEARGQSAAENYRASS